MALALNKRFGRLDGLGDFRRSSLPLVTLAWTRVARSCAEETREHVSSVDEQGACSWIVRAHHSADCQIVAKC
eukprot:6491434-Amphidinium_carterae.3